MIAESIPTLGLPCLVMSVSFLTIYSAVNRLCAMTIELLDPLKARSIWTCFSGRGHGGTLDKMSAICFNAPSTSSRDMDHVSAP